MLLETSQPKQFFIEFMKEKIKVSGTQKHSFKVCGFKAVQQTKKFPFVFAVVLNWIFFFLIKSPQKMSALWNKQWSHWWHEEAVHGQPSQRFWVDKSMVTYWNGSTTAKISHDSQWSQSPPFSQHSSLAVLTENPPLIIIGIQHHNTPPWRGLS